jgi:hypothetical protein
MDGARRRHITLIDCGPICRVTQGVLARWLRNPADVEEIVKRPTRGVAPASPVASQIDPRVHTRHRHTLAWDLIRHRNILGEVGFDEELFDLHDARAEDEVSAMEEIDTLIGFMLDLTKRRRQVLARNVAVSGERARSPRARV